MNIFRFFLFHSKSFVKIELSYVFTINMFSTAENCTESEISYKSRCFSLVCNYLRPFNNSRQLIFSINAVVLIVIICLDLRKWYNVYLDLSIFTVFLKNRNFIFKIRRSKVTDYAPLKQRRLSRVYNNAQTPVKPYSASR